MIGATTGYGLCWLVLLIVPMLAVVQALAAGVGIVCKTSLQGAIRIRFGLWWAVLTLCAVAGVNVITLAADVKAGSEALALLTHVKAGCFVVPFVFGVGWMLVNHSYSRIERYLSLLPLLFVCYAGSALLAHVDAGAMLRGMAAPAPNGSSVYIAGVLALLGTTLTSYVYIWESIEVAERPAGASVPRFRRDAAYGMFAVGIIFLFILIASAATLGKGSAPILTAADLAVSLEPLAGPWAATLFGAGLLGSAILAVPVIAGTTAYVAAHTFGWEAGLDASPRTAKAFYGVLLASLAIAGAAAFAPIPMVTFLFAASIAGGIATPLTLGFLTLIASNRSVMGEYVMSPVLTAGAWVVTVAVAATSAAFLTTAIPVSP